MGRAYWTAFNALPNVRKAEGELLEAYVRGSTRHMLVKYSDPAGQESATIACQNTHMALRVGVPLASVLSCLGESQRLTIEHVVRACAGDAERIRSEEHTSELQSLMRISYAVFCLKKKNTIKNKARLE